MYKVISKNDEVGLSTLTEAMTYAKTLDEFVTIKSKDYEIVGMFGSDSVENGKCPDGSAYTWMKRRNS
jgi:hypothetical protein